LRRIVEPDSGRALLLSFTAGMEIGVVPGMEDLPGMIGALAAQRRITGAIVHAGVLHSLFARFPELYCGTIVDLFGGTWLSTRPERREQICTLEHAVRAGADAVLATVSLGSPDESRQMRICGDIARQCDAWGMPLVVRIDTVETDAARQYSATLSGLGARLAYEIGADMVVVNYPGHPAMFADAVGGVDIPVLVGGAPNMETDDALINSVVQAVEAGASGVALAGPIFWNEGPTPALERLAAAVFTPARAATTNA
jgi:DhnA family fructose-bisphosphate aldolase class Ia